MKSNNPRVHLDHLIKRRSIRYFSKSDQEEKIVPPKNPDRFIRYEDIMADWFTRIKKPDFQRETTAWAPEQCVAFLESVIKGRIIPSIILWQNQESGEIFVLDGAHRLSVIRAWMVDDWGDSQEAKEYYIRRDLDEIQHIARKTRELVGLHVGHFLEFKEAHEEREKIIQNSGSPKREMSEKRFKQANFYQGVKIGNETLFTQWESGDYDSAEQSFLSINRQGQALDPWEATLIEYRKGSYSRIVMSIANGGEEGHYWPEVKPGEGVSQELINELSKFPQRSSELHKRLFIPPFKLPIISLTVPLVVADEYFQKHKYLLELIPLLAEQEIALEEEKQLALLSKDYQAAPEVVISNAARIFEKLENNIEHIVSLSHNSKSLSLVPLFYWYNQKGQFIRGLLYGFLYWLTTGTSKEVMEKKLIFSAKREFFEYVMFTYKADISKALGSMGGAGLKGVRLTASFFHELIGYFNLTPELTTSSSELEDKVYELLNTNSSSKKRKVSKSRNVSRSHKATVNIRELFTASTKCHICGGICNLMYGGVQYDHVFDFAKVKETEVDNLKPTHPFCNHQKTKIIELRDNERMLNLPPLRAIKEDSTSPQNLQLTIPFWGKEPETY